MSEYEYEKEKNEFENFDADWFFVGIWDCDDICGNIIQCTRIGKTGRNGSFECNDSVRNFRI